MKKQPKYIKEFSLFLDNGFIYQSFLSQIKSGKKKPPKASRTLLSEALGVSKNNLISGGYLTKEGMPTASGMSRSISLIGVDNKRTPLMKKAFLAPFILGAAVGDYEDTSFVNAVESYNRIKGRKSKRGSRSVSHTCKTESGLRSELNVLRKAMDKVFSCDTAFGTCNNNSMSSGHCMLSALIVQDLYGGKIMTGSVDGIPHYWNKLCHMEVDLTGDQFKKPKIQIRKDSLYGKSTYEFKRNPFESLNQDFNKEVWSKHCAFRQQVRKELEQIDGKLAEKLKSASKKLKA
jgi:hypothetical protein